MQLGKAVAMVVVLSGTTLVTGSAFSESTTTPVAKMKVGTVVTGENVPPATITEKTENSFSFRINRTNGPPMTVVVKGTAAHPNFTVSDGFKAINATLKAIGYGGDEIKPQCDIGITVNGDNNTVNVSCTVQ
jgi:hypothetical protein